MEITTSMSNKDTWQPAWERKPGIRDLLRPYSTATVVRDGGRSQPELWDICNGCILWLPPKQDVGEILDPELGRMHPGFFDHPVLILNIEVAGPRSATVQFTQMTSLGKRPLSHLPPHQRDSYLPISPAAPHPDSDVLLRLENEAPKRGMAEISYVSVIPRYIFSVDFRALRCYAAGQKADGYRQRLNEESFDEVMRKLGCISSAWIKTGSLWEHFLREHVATEVGRAD